LFEIVIQSKPDPSLDDLAKGAGGDYRYLIISNIASNPKKIVNVSLLRSDSGVPQPPSGWDAMTIDINKGRGKTYLYLIWTTVTV
jgi:hypothetical protein